MAIALAEVITCAIVESSAYADGSVVSFCYSGAGVSCGMIGYALLCGDTIYVYDWQGGITYVRAGRNVTPLAVISHSARSYVWESISTATGANVARYDSNEDASRAFYAALRRNSATA